MLSMLEPMLASLAEAPLDDPQLVYEPKYDGIRAIVEVPAGGARRAALVASRQREDARSFLRSPTRSARGRGRVASRSCSTARSSRSTPRGSRPDSSSSRAASTSRTSCAASADRGQPAVRQRLPAPSSALAFIAFDLLRDGAADLRDRPLTERRAVARAPVRARPARRSCASASRCAATVARCTSARTASGWEGLIAKRADSRYQSGKRTPDWRKLKIVHEQEFVIGGWTEPRNSRTLLRRAAARRLRRSNAERARPRSTIRIADLRRARRDGIQRARARAADEAAQAARDHESPVQPKACRPTSGRTG